MIRFVCLIFACALASCSVAERALGPRLSDLLGASSRPMDLAEDAETADRLPSAADRGVVLRDTAAFASDAEWQCLSEALYFEARGESDDGLYAVGEVILNRVDSSAYPDTVCGVVNQGTGRLHACQFSYTCDGRPEVFNNSAAHERTTRIARDLLDGAPRDLTDGATHYHMYTVSPSWSRRFPRTTTIGVHHFYRRPGAN